MFSTNPFLMLFEKGLIYQYAEILSFAVTCFRCSHKYPFQAMQVMSIAEENENEFEIFFGISTNK